MAMMAADTTMPNAPASAVAASPDQLKPANPILSALVFVGLAPGGLVVDIMKPIFPKQFGGWGSLIAIPISAVFWLGVLYYAMRNKK
jgi:hypothetical protein